MKQARALQLLSFIWESSKKLATGATSFLPRAGLIRGKAMRAARIIPALLHASGLALALVSPVRIRCAELPDAPIPRSEFASPEPAALGEGVTLVRRDPCGAVVVGKDSTCLKSGVSPGNAYPLSSAGKLRAAGADVIDPGNLVTIAGSAAVFAATTPHSTYGPGFKGFARYAGVSLAGSATGDFFCSFLVPAVTHQDPRYRRMPKASALRRIAHSATQVVWTRSDSGRNMPNYGNLLGLAMTDAVANLYVPGQRTNVPSTAGRWAVGIASSPIDNLLTEFIPDVAQHVHFRVVLFQHMMERMTRPDPQ